ncbi:hypothetical protein F4780DRAFT_725177 [Xylariomycetidae sp. FL0641]|nr:hypothetical protein F4780DRAFT_725177 [Xylariomycetidae sp. FL0641]
MASLVRRPKPPRTSLPLLQVVLIPAIATRGSPLTAPTSTHHRARRIPLLWMTLSSQISTCPRDHGAGYGSYACCTTNKPT